jgi:hypothetical protein
MSQCTQSCTAAAVLAPFEATKANTQMRICTLLSIMNFPFFPKLYMPIATPAAILVGVRQCEGACQHIKGRPSTGFLCQVPDSGFSDLALVGMEKRDAWPV